MGLEKDCWARWIEQMRSVGGPEVRRKGLEQHAVWRERILDNAQLRDGERLIDVGCGEGLVAFGALARGASEVIFSDVSGDLLDFCREAATELGVLERCRFVLAAADDLRPIADESVDVVTTRSVLIYVDDKERAFHEFARVMRPGGRISLFEPINRFARRDSDTWMGYDLSAVREIAVKVRAVYDAIQPLDLDPMLNFDERDLVDLAERVGLFPIRLQLEVEIKRTEAMPWSTFVERAGNPRIPTIGDAIDQALNPEERERFVEHLRPLVEEGRGTWRMATAFLTASKP